MPTTNVLTNFGEQWVVERLSGTNISGLQGNNGSNVGWGTGTVANVPATLKALTALATEVSSSGGTRVAGTVQGTGTLASAKWVNVAALTATGAVTITEAGVYSGTATGATGLFVRGEFTGIVLANTEQIQFTFTLDPA